MFEPPDAPINPVVWKPSKELSSLAMSRCNWVNCEAINSIPKAEDWLGAIIVGAYYQGLADGVKHMARKQRKAEKGKSNV